MTDAGKEVKEKAEFTAPEYQMIPGALATAPGTGRTPGMLWKTHQLALKRQLIFMNRKFLAIKPYRIIDQFRNGLRLFLSCLSFPCLSKSSLGSVGVFLVQNSDSQCRKIS